MQLLLLYKRQQANIWHIQVQRVTFSPKTIVLMKKIHQEVRRIYLKSHSRHYTGESQKFKMINWHQNHTTKKPVP